MNHRDYMVYQDEIEDNCFRFSNGNEISFSQIAYELTKRTSRLKIKVYGISYNGKLPPDVFLQADYGFNHIRIKLEKEMFLNADKAIYDYLANKLINSFGNYMFGGEE